MRDKPPADTSSQQEADQPPESGRKLIGLFDLRANSIEDIVKAAVDAMERAGL